MLLQVDGQSAGVIADELKHPYSLLSVTLVVGLASMALIQLFKDLLPVRRWFQRSWVRNWLNGKKSQLDRHPERWSFAQVAVSLSKNMPRQAPYHAEDTDTAESELVQLAADGDDKAFYNLPIEQLCGQMNAAAQAVLDHPMDYPSLLLHLGCLSSTEDIRLLLSPPPSSRPTNTQGEIDPAAQQAIQNFVDARNRVTHQIQRAIDALQVSSGTRWKLWIQIFSIVLSGLFAWLAVPLFGPVHGWQEFITVIVVALLGGFLAPIARDIIAGLQQLRA